MRLNSHQRVLILSSRTSAMGRKRTATRGCNQPQAAVQLAKLKSHVWACWRSQEDSRRVLSRPEDPVEVLREMKGRRTQATGTTRMDPTPNAAKTRRRWNISVGTTVAVVTMQNTQGSSLGGAVVAGYQCRPGGANPCQMGCSLKINSTESTPLLKTEIAKR